MVTSVASAVYPTASCSMWPQTSVGIVSSNEIQNLSRSAVVL